MKLPPKQQQGDILNRFKAGESIPNLAYWFNCTQREIESVIRLRLFERGPGRASYRDANRLLKLVGKK